MMGLSKLFLRRGRCCGRNPLLMLLLAGEGAVEHSEVRLFGPRWGREFADGIFFLVVIRFLVVLDELGIKRVGLGLYIP